MSKFIDAVTAVDSGVRVAVLPDFPLLDVTREVTEVPYMDAKQIRVEVRYGISQTVLNEMDYELTVKAVKDALRRDIYGEFTDLLHKLRLAVRTKNYEEADTLIQRIWVETMA